MPWEQTTVLLSPRFPLLTPVALRSEVISPHQVFQVPSRCWYMSSLVTKSCKLSVANRFDDLRPDIWTKQGFVTQGQWGKLSFLLCDCGSSTDTSSQMDLGTKSDVSPLNIQISQEEYHATTHLTHERLHINLIYLNHMQGSVIPVVLDLTANHQGWFTFKICPNNDIWYQSISI